MNLWPIRKYEYNNYIECDFVLYIPIRMLLQSPLRLAQKSRNGLTSRSQTIAPSTLTPYVKLKTKSRNIRHPKIYFQKVFLNGETSSRDSVNCLYDIFISDRTACPVDNRGIRPKGVMTTIVDALHFFDNISIYFSLTIYILQYKGRLAMHMLTIIFFVKNNFLQITIFEIFKYLCSKTMFSNHCIFQIYLRSICGNTNFCSLN